MKNRTWLLVLIGAVLVTPFRDGEIASAQQQPGKPTTQPKQPTRPAHDPLPINHWDTKLLQAIGTIVSTHHDKENNQVFWVIETKKFEHPGRVTPVFRDDEGSKLATGPDLVFMLMRKEKNDKNERVLVMLKLPGEKVMKEAFHVFMYKVRD